jgi:hypothetical protein
MRKLLLFLFLACLSPAVVGKALSLPTDTINNHQVYLNKKPLLFAHANIKREDLTISLVKKNLKNTDTLGVAYGSCARTYAKYQLSLQDTTGKVVWETTTQTNRRTKIPASVLLKSKEKELNLYFGKVFLAKITLY